MILFTCTGEHCSIDTLAGTGDIYYQRLGLLEHEHNVSGHRAAKFFLAGK